MADPKFRTGAHIPGRMSQFERRMSSKHQRRLDC
jgi:hypothetical protein